MVSQTDMVFTHDFKGDPPGTPDVDELQDHLNIIQTWCHELRDILNRFSALDDQLTRSSVRLHHLHPEIKAYLRDIAEAIGDPYPWQMQVLEALRVTPPASPSDGDRYIVGGLATGLWLGQDNNIAEWQQDSGSWGFFTAEIGFAAYDLATDQLYIRKATGWAVNGVDGYGDITNSYAIAETTIAAGTTRAGSQSPTSGPNSKKGQALRVSVAVVGAASGQVTIRFFDDSAKTSIVYDAVFDLADPRPDGVPWYFDSESTAGTLWYDIINHTGASLDVDITILSKTLLLQNYVPNVITGAGNGLGVDGAGDLEVDIGTSGGLEIDGAAALRVKVNAAAAVPVVRTAAGLEVSNAVSLTAAQTVSGAKTLTGGLRIAPAGSDGPPTSGTYAVGALHVDLSGDLWACYTAGTPGLWWNVTAKRQLTAITQSGVVASGTGASLDLDLLARQGNILKFWVWAYVASGGVPAATNFEAPARVRCFPNASRRGYEQTWEIPFQCRGDYFDTGGAAPGVDTITPNSNDPYDNGDLLRLLDVGAGTSEYARLISRASGQLGLDEAIQAPGGFAANDIIVNVAEFFGLPFYNDDSTPANYNKLHLELRNDSATHDLIFNIQALVMNDPGRPV